MLDTKIFTSFLLTNRNWKNSKEENQRIDDAKHWKVNCLDTFPLEAQQHQIKGESCDLQVQIDLKISLMENIFQTTPFLGSILNIRGLYFVDL